RARLHPLRRRIQRAPGDDAGVRLHPQDVALGSRSGGTRRIARNGRMQPRRPGAFVAAVRLAVAREGVGPRGGPGAGAGGVAAADAAVGLAYLCCGLLLRKQKGHRRIALLFLATGIAWLAGTLAASDVAALSSVGSALLYVHRGPFVQLVLAYPTGRLTSRL